MFFKNQSTLYYQLCCRILAKMLFVMCSNNQFYIEFLIPVVMWNFAFSLAFRVWLLRCRIFLSCVNGHGSREAGLNANSFIESTVNQSYKVFWIPVVEWNFAFQLAFRAICQGYEIVKLSVICPRVKAWMLTARWYGELPFVSGLACVFAQSQ